MAHISLHGELMKTAGELPRTGVLAPSFTLTGTDLREVRLQDFAGKNVVLNIFPSIDTPVCAMSVREFNRLAAGTTGTVVLSISADLPFAHQRFCETEGLENVVPLSVFRSPSFGMDYGVTIMDGPFSGLLARAVVLVDSAGMVVHTQLVGDISQEPDYPAALKVLSGI